MKKKKKHEDFVICRAFFPPFFEKNKKIIKLAISRPRQFLEKPLIAAPFVQIYSPPRTIAIYL